MVGFHRVNDVDVESTVVDISRTQKRYQDQNTHWDPTEGRLFGKTLRFIASTNASFVLGRLANRNIYVHRIR